jgi:hypothetical protein
MQLSIRMDARAVEGDRLQLYWSQVRILFHAQKLTESKPHRVGALFAKQMVLSRMWFVSTALCKIFQKKTEKYFIYADRLRNGFRTLYR